MSGNDFKARKLEVMDVDLRVTLQGSTLKIELPLPSTGNPNEIPLAAIDQQKANTYLTKAENRLTDYLASQGVNNFRVDKLTGSGKGGTDAGVVKLELQTGAEANRIFSDKNFLRSLQENFDADRGREHMKAAASWVENSGARVPYADPQKKDAKEVVVKVEDSVAFNFYKDNHSKVYGVLDLKKNEQLGDLTQTMVDRGKVPGVPFLKLKDHSSVEMDFSERAGQSQAAQTGGRIADAALNSKANESIGKPEIYRNDGAPFQFDKQNLFPAANTTPSPTLVEGNEAINKLFRQAISAVENTNVPNKLDAAALAVQTISQAPGFKQDQDISVMEGKRGLIVSQGEGPASINMLVAEAKQGDLQKVSAQMTQSHQMDAKVAALALPDENPAKQQSARAM